MRNLGKIYYQTSDWQQGMWYQLSSVIKKSKIDLNQIGSILDLGCGSGARTAQLPEIFPQLKKLVAIDSNSQMIAEARSRKKNEAIDYQLLNIDDIDKLDSPAFEVTISSWALHWVADKERLMKNLHSVMPLDSYLIVSTCEGLPPLLQVVDQEIRNHFKITETAPFHFLKAADWAHLLHRHGWKMIVEEKKVIRHTVAERQPFLKHWYAASVGEAFYQRSMNEIGKEFINDLIKTLDEKFSGLHANSWEFPESTFFFVAQRER